MLEVKIYNSITLSWTMKIFAGISSGSVFTDVSLMKENGNLYRNKKKQTVIFYLILAWRN
jgi:activator of 2-hydroxyglutaryl-CoA dehydratase